MALPRRNQPRAARRPLNSWRQEELLDGASLSNPDLSVPPPIYHAQLRTHGEDSQIRRHQAVRLRRGAELVLIALAVMAGVLLLVRLLGAVEAPERDAGREIILIGDKVPWSEPNVPIGNAEGIAAFVADPFIRPAITPPMSAKSFMLVDLNQRTVLLDRDADTPRAPASLAKLATAVVALEQADARTRIQIPAEARNQPPNVVGLVPGDVLTLQDLLFAMLLDSANDAAVAIADGIGGDQYTVHQMNDLAGRLGLTQTRFGNPVGYDDVEQQSTAYELAVLAADALERFPLIARIVSTGSYVIPAGLANRTYTAMNINDLLLSYEGAFGVKTGRTDTAGGNIIAAAERNGHRLMVVVLGSSEREKDARTLLDFGFQLADARG